MRTKITSIIFLSFMITPLHETMHAVGSRYSTPLVAKSNQKTPKLDSILSPERQKIADERTSNEEKTEHARNKYLEVKHILNEINDIVQSLKDHKISNQTKKILNEIAIDTDKKGAHGFNRLIAEFSDFSCEKTIKETKLKLENIATIMQSITQALEQEPSPKQDVITSTIKRMEELQKKISTFLSNRQHHIKSYVDYANSLCSQQKTTTETLAHKPAQADSDKKNSPFAQPQREITNSPHNGDITFDHKPLNRTPAQIGFACIMASSSLALYAALNNLHVKYGPDMPLIHFIFSGELKRVFNQFATKKEKLFTLTSATIFSINILALTLFNVFFVGEQFAQASSHQQRLT